MCHGFYFQVRTREIPFPVTKIEDDFIVIGAVHKHIKPAVVIEVS